MFNHSDNCIPVIDIFAGPGGLGEGFSALLNPADSSVFKIALSIEKDSYAHSTLTLRSFFRQFKPGKVPLDYYDFLKGNITLSKLYEKWPLEAAHAKKEAWHATLGDGENATPYHIVDERIREALNGNSNWLLIGGPPCQAYSVVGRSRRQEKILDESKDERVGLYKQYLRILAIHNPAVFVMENVKGLLSATTKESPVFTRILSDLKDPVSAYLQDNKSNGQLLNCPGYKIYSLVSSPKGFDIEGNPVYTQKDFLIKAEQYGIPQTRHRVILLGVRNDIEFVPGILKPTDEIPISKVLADLPRLRSSLSKSENTSENWREAITQISKRGTLAGVEAAVREEISKQLSKLTIPRRGWGADYISQKADIAYKPEWYLDEKLDGIANHESRGHMDSDLLRYFFVACFGRVNNVSPKLENFPVALLPDHKNVEEGINEKKFADRFRVQLSNSPSKTVTSHISKDGHYYIHPDPSQCRSFTVREAARIQTFPDNYYFYGGRTQQFHQVGNAVPPYLAYQIAEVVAEIFTSIPTLNIKRYDVAEV